MREGIRLVEPRGNPSPFWTYASPVLAVVAHHRRLRRDVPGDGQTAALGGLCVPRRAAGADRRPVGARGQGGAADHDRGGARALLPRLVWNIGCRGPVHRRRDLSRRHRAGAARPAGADPLSGCDHRRRDRRRGDGGADGVAAHLAQRQRDPLQPDGDLCRAISADLSRHRAVEGPAGLRLPADGDVLRTRR